ncbi:MAG TPA: DUF4231 domain-containing protein [Solirubrobacteraceae bacterium]|jgi:hypothetical protein|nr:DUF4231 domain-containing protein [Solirubrobacteraceae bacterium]
MSAQHDPARDAGDKLAVELAQKRLRWYRREARKARLGYQYLELAQLVAGALVPVSVATGWDTAVTASLGAAVVLAGGARAVFQWHDNWLGFIGAQMQIERELALYEVGALPYADAHRGQTLVREVERIALEETQGWRARRQADRDAAAADAPEKR